MKRTVVGTFGKQQQVICRFGIVRVEPARALDPHHARRLWLYDELCSLRDPASLLVTVE
jgi:hypothetical protein